MMTQLRRIAWFLLRMIHLESLMMLRRRSALFEDGWFRSFRAKESVDKRGAPVPWFTYPAIDFITPRMTGDMHVLEFGCGHSTLFFAHRVNSVTSVEHDKVWLDKIARVAPGNVELIFRGASSGGEYVGSPGEPNKYDIVVIDGMDRVGCVESVLRSGVLKEDGILVFDNADRSEYMEAYDMLSENKFKRIDFHGMGPINAYKWCTSIFFRQTTWLNSCPLG